MKTIKLSDSQIRNANIFLDRVELKGLKEAIALIELYRSINSIDKNEQDNAIPKPEGNDPVME